MEKMAESLLSPKENGPTQPLKYWQFSTKK
jgi:hypothetical protein